MGSRRVWLRDSTERSRRGFGRCRYDVYRLGHCVRFCGEACRKKATTVELTVPDSNRFNKYCHTKFLLHIPTNGGYSTKLTGTEIRQPTLS